MSSKALISRGTKEEKIQTKKKDGKKGEEKDQITAQFQARNSFFIG